MTTSSGGLTVRSAHQTYGFVVLAVVLLLALGLIVPLAFGDPESSINTVSAGGGAAPQGPLTTESITSEAVSDDGAAGDAPVGSVGGNPAAAGRSAPSAGPGAPAPTDGQLTASDVGVTPLAIKVGVVLLDLEAVGPLGLALDNHDLESQRRGFQVLFDEINKAGGINGRRIEPVYVRNDPLESGAHRARCVDLAKDKRVFAVVGFVTEEVACLVQEHRIPTVAYTTYPAELYAGTGHYLMTAMPTLERAAANWVGALHDMGSLRDRTVGIVAGEAAFEAIPADAIDRTLAALGYKTTYRTRLSSDASVGQQQLPVEVQRMRRAGVDTVFFPTNFATARMWVETAESQGWAPQYLTSNIGALVADPLVERMPRSFDGAIGITNNYSGFKSGVSERPVDAACRNKYNAAADGKDYAYGEVTVLQNACPMIEIFHRAAVGAGGNLTRDGLAAAAQRLGAFPMPYYQGGRLGPGKTDYNDIGRPMKWEYSCRCYMVLGPPRPGRY